MLSKIRLNYWRTHVVAWILLVALFGVAGIATSTVLAYRRATFELIVERNRQVTHLSAARMHDELAKFSQALAALARTQEMTGRDLEAQRQALRTAAFVQQGLFDGGVVLLDTRGRVTAAVPGRPEIVGMDWSNYSYFRQLLSTPGAVYSNAMGHGPEGTQAVVVSVAILDGDGQFSGALAGMLRLGEMTISPLYASIVRLRIDHGGSTFLLDGQRRILFDSVGDRVGELYATIGTTDPLLSGQAGTLRVGAPGAGEMILSYAPVPGTPWTLVTEDDWQGLMGPTRRYVDLLLTLLGAGMILPLVGAGVLYARQRDARLADEEGQNQELRIANELKDALMPPHAPIVPGWNLPVYHQPAVEPGGGFYDFVLLADGRLMFAMGETIESGMATALTLATIRTTLRCAARTYLAPAQVLQSANENLCAELPVDTAVCCFFGILDPVDGVVHYANTGHVPVWHWHDDQIDELDGEGLPLGTSLDSVYEAHSITIRPGECLLVFHRQLLTHGNAQGEPFGLPTVQAHVERDQGRAAHPIAAVRSALQEFLGGGSLVEPPLTLFMLQRLAAAAAESGEIITRSRRADAARGANVTRQVA
ncbi:MAG: SpoIIE family protein phosphatase [Litorilinea sp.]